MPKPTDLPTAANDAARPDLPADEAPTLVDASASAPAAPVDGVVVRLVAPFFVRAYRTTLASGDTLAVTQTGVSVPSGDVDSLIADAATRGVTLERSK